MKPFFNSCVVAAIFVLSQTAMAQSAGVSSTLSAKVVEQAGSKTVLSSAEKAKPGDVVEYRAVYANKGTSTAKQLLATVPIPPNTTLLVNTAEPSNAQGSLDGVTFATLPLVRKVKQPNGTLQEVPVALAEYRALRWEVGTVNAGAQAQVSLRVRINPTLAPTPATSSKL
jgi:uncharacterized repeat protein (TIGR01451 family)